MLSIKAATLADVEAIARVDVETWRETYAGLLPDHLLIGLDQRQRAHLWSRFIARRPGDTVTALDDHGQVVGFGSCGAQRESDLPFAGEVFTLYVAPDAQGVGVGRCLLIALFVRLVRCGHYSAVIWVLDENPARFFYERLGGRIVARRRLVVGNAPVEAIAYGWTDLPAVIQSRGKAVPRAIAEE